MTKTTSKNSVRGKVPLKSRKEPHNVEVAESNKRVTEKNTSGIHSIRPCQIKLRRVKIPVDGEVKNTTNSLNRSAAWPDQRYQHQRELNMPLRKCYVKLQRIKEIKERSCPDSEISTSHCTRVAANDVITQNPTIRALKSLRVRLQNINPVGRTGEQRKVTPKFVSVSSTQNLEYEMSRFEPNRNSTLFQEPSSKLEGDPNENRRGPSIGTEEKHQKLAKLIFKKPHANPSEKRNRMSTRGKSGSLGVFEFPSLSQSYDLKASNNKDPAADIIQRMIATGKVLVATRRNGRGIIKRKKQTRQAPTKNLKKTKQVPVSRNQIQSHEDILHALEKEPILHDNDVENQEECALSGSDNDCVQNRDEYGLFHDIFSPSDDANLSSVNLSKHHELVNDGTFSRLARSVLIQQAEKNDIKRNDVTERRRLLAAVQKFVSTPVYRQVPPLPPTSNISPITGGHRTGNVSPWRVNAHANYPNVFNFGTNSSCLPTFSSDSIPATPKKSHQRQSRNDLSATPLRSNLAGTMTTETAWNGSLSSRSSNDSNAENVPPPAVASKSSDPLSNIFNLRQTSNARRALGSCRSPLKTINILEVITLPPWQKKASNINVNASHDIVVDGQIELEKSNDMFGFEEFLLDEHEELEKTLPGASDGTLRDKLHELRKWRPEDDVLRQFSKEQSAVMLDENYRADDWRAMKQRSIKEMLCSTMIQPSLRPKDSDWILENENVTEQSNLFKDPDQKSTLDKSQPRRTYSRPMKRKRKLRQNIVLFSDSTDSSGSEDHDDRDKPKKSNKGKENMDLKSFVSEFNEMCKEVEQYQLIVE